MSVGVPPQDAGYLRALFAQRRFEDAIVLAQRLTEQFPQDQFGWNALGGALGAVGRTNEAIMPLRRAVELNPGEAMVHSNLGAAQLNLGRLAEAIASLQRALQIRPQLLDAWNNLGVALRRLGRNEDAIQHFQRVIELSPGHVEAHNNQGLSFHELGRLQEAENSYRHALVRAPSFAQALNNLALTLRYMGRLAEAEECCRRALQVRPEFGEARSNLALTLQLQGRSEEAIAECRQALAIRPGYADAQGNLLFCLNYIHATSEEILANARAYGDMVRVPPEQRFQTWNRRLPEGRLRVGLVSGDLREHPVGHLISAWLTHRDRDRLELFAYPSNPQFDATSGQIKLLCDAWRPLIGLTDRQAADLIHEDGVDVLLDLSGHTGGQRLRVFAYKPAPVQVSCLGYFATTGVEEMDYVVADPWCAPREQDANFTEQVWRLAHSRFCFAAPDASPEPGPLPTLANGTVTFACCNNLGKVGDECLALWARILHAVPGSRILLKAPQLIEEGGRARIRERFADHGIGGDRLLLELPSPRSEYLTVYRKIDIALDPFPFAGGATTFDALWMGVPVLTMSGERLVSRQGVGILANAGLDEWIATDAEDYLAKAVRFAGDLELLSGLREGLRNALRASALMDGAGFARDIEDALFGMFEARTAREQSQGFLLQGAERTRQGDLAGALREFSAAVAADPTNPAAHYNLGVSCKHAGRFREAAQAYENALLHARRSPESDEAHLQAAYCYLFLGEREACLAHLDLYQRKVAPKPGGPDAKTRMNVATFYLLLGMWDKAWPLYESRWEDPSIQAPHSWPPGKLWLGGEDPKQMTILVHAEQGIGDTIQFARYLPLLAQRAGRVRLVVPEFHKPLLRTIVDVESMFCAEGETPEYDRHIPLLSLPLALGTNADSIPSKVPYVAVPPAYRERWRERLGAKYKLRVGISWSGRPGHVNDANRSIPLHALAPLFESDASSACEWISVQKDLRSGDHVLLGQYGIRHFGDDLFDMADTAALAEQMDLVICVDTSVAHVCGALGRKAWVLLPFVPDWRWMLDRGDSPWYPSIELFRQPTAGDWNAVVQGLAARLTSVTAPK